MSHDLFSSLDSFVAASSAASSLLVRDVAGEYRPAEADEVLQAAQRVLAGSVRGTDVLTSPAVVKDFLGYVWETCRMRSSRWSIWMRSTVCSTMWRCSGAP